ncbi:MAG: hypothetical protein Sv326_0428 [Candidatus Fermentimicrarchaeum limneticum]|uniref:Uncharacterized protein n=1 Tax=Fermentimicrarchaeum limneticum TaxID=2795018 RepID=A0A7D5XJE8_FERL1|nr:MAG: hypothetical protein Sv326_0354 [Candidatus Fermentimicrarchaeum limneticum]QLJ52566.1 MAG: hypothetical protein Sv326_0391 [Candidatus Fermentimicrarchaeum limneticum]QLJ52603.1 MAG: hypothetical protein Sv326_0428 [Candidatus Fermentimicrarchaeum limneticum]
MTCHYENYEDDVLGRVEVVGYKCVSCREAVEQHGGYTKCPRFKRIQNGGWER